jgi:hypothetical protein
VIRLLFSRINVAWSLNGLGGRKPVTREDSSKALVIFLVHREEIWGF